MISKKLVAAKILQKYLIPASSRTFSFQNKIDPMISNTKFEKQSITNIFKENESIRSEYFKIKTLGSFSAYLSLGSSILFANIPMIVDYSGMIIIGSFLTYRLLSRLLIGVDSQFGRYLYLGNSIICSGMMYAPLIAISNGLHFLICPASIISTLLIVPAINYTAKSKLIGQYPDSRFSVINRILFGEVGQGIHDIVKDIIKSDSDNFLAIDKLLWEFIGILLRSTLILIFSQFYMDIFGKFQIKE